MRHLAAFAALFSLSTALGQVNENTPGWFAFDMPGLEAPSGTPVDLSGLTTEPAGGSGFLQVKDGHFADGRGQRVRLIGTNITGDSCFMEPETADRLALRLRQWGFNCVRLHFMDFTRKSSIWEDAKTGTLSEDQLKRLDHLVAAFAKNGIYTNLNLHVGRDYPGQPKIPGSRLLRFGKTLDRWYEPYVVMIEEYARGLLDRRNTVTGIRWGDDPAICAIEINNENTLVNRIRPEYRQLPDPWRSAFLAKWNAWLRARYGTIDALRKAWNRDVRPLGEEILDGPWIVQNSQGAESELIQDGNVWRWTATKTGSSSWNLQMQYKELRLPPGRYTLSLRARSKTGNRISHTLMLDTDPWGTVGLRATLDLKPEWQTFTITTPVTEPSVDGPLRLNLSLGNKVGEVEFADFSLRPGGGNGLPPEQTLEKGIGIPEDSVTDDVVKDWFAFLIDTEMGTTKRLVSFLKKDLGCRAPITDTQVSYGGAGGVRRESELSDYIDIHGYWEHPSYTRNEKGWTTGFSMRNTTQVANSSAGTLGNMAFHRVKGFPFTVSEYNTPAPNDHGAELFPLLAAMAALQDWDGLYSYTYRDFGKNYEDTRIRKYFHLIGRSNLLVHIPAAIHLFRLGGLKPAPELTTVVLPNDQAPQLARKEYRLSSLWAKQGASIGSAWFRRVELAQKKTGAPQVLAPLALSEGMREGGAVNWHPNDTKGPWFSLNTPSVRLLVGHVGGRQFKLDDASITVDQRPWARDLPAYACISLTALDQQPIAQSRRLLLAASARTENTNMAWNDDRTSLVGKDGWGGKTTISEAIPLTLALPGAPFRAAALNALGQPGKPVQVNGNALRLRAEDRTLWVLIER
jgi:hypothetical protein